MLQANDVTSVTAENYRHASALLQTLLDEIRDNEAHPLIDVLDNLSDKIMAYEDSLMMSLKLL